MLLIFFSLFRIITPHPLNCSSSSHPLTSRKTHPSPYPHSPLLPGPNSLDDTHGAPFGPSYAREHEPWVREGKQVSPGGEGTFAGVEEGEHD